MGLRLSVATDRGQDIWPSSCWMGGRTVQDGCPPEWGKGVDSGVKQRLASQAVEVSRGQGSVRSHWITHTFININRGYFLWW